MRRTVLAFVAGLLAGVAIMLAVGGPLEVAVLGGARDMQLEARVRAALALQKDFALFGGISVEANEDTVTLSGTVASAEQLQLAELIAKGVDGVEGVVNGLEVHSDAEPEPEVDPG